MVATIFERFEKKFIITKSVYEKVYQELLSFVAPDKYGWQKIVNLFYDTDDFYLINNSLSKPVYKQKMRIRSYGVPTLNSTVFLELKKKFKGKVYKRRVVLPLKDAYKMVETKSPVNVKDDHNLREIRRFIAHYDLKPTCYLSYNRIALYGIEDSSLRITFDRDILYRSHDVRMENGDFGTYLKDDDFYIMEIKVSTAIPLPIVKILNKYNVLPGSFSKYGNAYVDMTLNDSHETLVQEDRESVGDEESVG